MPVRTRLNVPLTEEFVGENDFSRYTSLIRETSTLVMGNNGSNAYPWGLGTQAHIDIRTFNPTNSRYPENWTNSTGVSFSTGPKPYLNNWNALVSSADGVTAYTSIAGKLDLTSLGPNSEVILALPNWPQIYNDPTQTFLDFSSDNFVTYASVAFSASTSPLLNSDSVATWPISAFVGTDMTAITGVRIRVTNYDSANMIFAALRLVGPSWTPANVDIDNWNGSIQQAIPPNGRRGSFPVANNLQLPSLWYSAPTTGIDDPQPINIMLGTVFNTGSMLFSNSFSIFMRGVGGADTSQLMLNGLTQAALTGPQPGLTQSDELPRRVADLQGLSMQQLTGQDVLNLSERQANVAASWTAFNLTWGTGVPSVGVTTSVTGNGYVWSGSSASAIANLTPNTFYLCLMSLQDTVAQIQILPLNQTNYAIISPGAPVFDTGPIRDSYLFPRRPGRLGWQANLLDGDAQIKSIRPHALTFAEYRSTALNSNTPVKGGRLYAQVDSDEGVWRSWSPLDDTNGVAPKVTIDTSHFDVDHTDHASTRIDVMTASAASPAQGIISNVLSTPEDPSDGIIDWTHVQLTLSLWMPPEALTGASTLSISLLSQDGYTVPLTVPGLIPSTWQQIILYPPPVPPGMLVDLQSGRYQLLIRYSGPATTFWVDNVRVIEHHTTWAIRANPTDPWVRFMGLVSSDDAGALVNPGTALQVRAQAHRQDEIILQPPRVVPLYASLGRLVWPENASIDPILSYPTFSTSSSPTHNQPVSFDATRSFAVNNVTNQVPDYSMEQGTQTWTKLGANTLTRTTAFAHSGSYSQQATYQDVLSLAIVNNYGNLVQNEVRTIAAWVYIPNSWTGGTISVSNTLDGTGMQVMTSRNANLTLTNQWQLIWKIYNTPVGAFQRAIWVQAASASPGQSIYIDDAYDIPGDARTNIINYTWDFGDGNVASGDVVTHTYMASGTYTVTLIVTDSWGVRTSTSSLLAVS